MRCKASPARLCPGLASQVDAALVKHHSGNISGVEKCIENGFLGGGVMVFSSPEWKNIAKL
jgi:hypothetical protein